MGWSKVPLERKEQLARAAMALGAFPRTMFGCPSWFAGGNLFAIAHEDNLVLRFNEDDRREMLDVYPEAHNFDPLGGRPMREYLVLPPVVRDDPDLFSAWMAKSHAYALSLPVKEKKTGSPSRKA